MIFEVVVLRWTDGPRNHTGGQREPMLNLGSTREHLLDTIEDEPSNVRSALVLIVTWDRINVVQLFPDLLTSTNKGDTVDVGHDRLLDDLPSDVSVEECGDGVTQGHVLRDLCLDQLRDTGIDVLRSVTRFQVDLLCTLPITTERCIMLQSIAGTILGDDSLALVFGWVRTSQCFRDGDTSGETLPWVFCVKPPSIALSWLSDINASLKGEV